MTKNNQDELARAYAMLQALRKNVEKMTKLSIEETFVHEFHSALGKLTGIKIDVSEFRIPDSEIAPIRTSIPVYSWDGGDNGRATYSKEKYVNKEYFLMKIDTALGYFEIITSEKPRKIGFSK